jgi:methionyl-tRNA synthetase
VIGKDITRLHCVIWPAMLQAAGLPLPRAVWAHGFVTLGGERFSKSPACGWTWTRPSIGTAPTPSATSCCAKSRGTADGGFTWERFDERYTAELANDLGNLANRSLSMLAKYRDGVVPAAGRTSLDAFADAPIARYRERMDGCCCTRAPRRPSHGLGGERFIVQHAPWKLAKEPERAAELDATLASLVRVLGGLAVLLSPFMPEKMAALWERLGSGAACPRLDALPGARPAGWRPQPGRGALPAAGAAQERACGAPQATSRGVPGGQGCRELDTFGDRVSLPLP